MTERPEIIWFELYCKSRSRMGLQVPPFRWRHLTHWWGWKVYVIRPSWRWLWAKVKESR